MHEVESSPPLSIGALVAVILLLAGTHVWQLQLSRVAPVALWQTGVAVAATLLLVAVLAWLVQAKRYVLTSEELQVRRALRLGSTCTHPLAELTSVGIVGSRPWGNTVIVATFRGDIEVRVPRYYSNASPLFRLLLSRLGANIASKGAARISMP